SGFRLPQIAHFGPPFRGGIAPSCAWETFPLLGNAPGRDPGMTFARLTVPSPDHCVAACAREETPMLSHTGPADQPATDRPAPRREAVARRGAAPAPPAAEATMTSTRPTRRGVSEL